MLFNVLRHFYKKHVDGVRNGLRVGVTNPRSSLTGSGDAVLYIAELAEG